MCLLDRGPRRPRSSAIAAPPEADRTGGDTWITPPSRLPDLASDATREVRHRGRPTLCTDIPSALRLKRPSLRNFAPFMSAPQSEISSCRMELRTPRSRPAARASSVIAKSARRVTSTVGPIDRQRAKWGIQPRRTPFRPASICRCGELGEVEPARVRLLDAAWAASGGPRHAKEFRAGAHSKAHYSTLPQIFKFKSVKADHPRSNASTPPNGFHLSVMRAFPSSLHRLEFAKRHPTGRAARRVKQEGNFGHCDCNNNKISSGQRVSPRGIPCSQMTLFASVLFLFAHQ